MIASTRRASSGARSRLPIIDDIANAVRGADVAKTQAGDRLRAISNQAVVDNLEVFPDEVRINDDVFEGPLTLHVTLKFTQGGEELSVAESFPGVFQGRIISGAPVIDALDTDTSSFFR